jgi:hypothetical protein
MTGAPTLTQKERPSARVKAGGTHCLLYPPTKVDSFPAAPAQSSSCLVPYNELFQLCAASRTQCVHPWRAEAGINRRRQLLWRTSTLSDWPWPNGPCLAGGNGAGLWLRRVAAAFVPCLTILAHDPRLLCSASGRGTPCQRCAEPY